MDFDDSTFLETFGTSLRDARNRAKISQEELASQAGLDRTYISLLERGKRNPSLVCIGKLADALQIPIGQIFDAERRSAK
ncbi:MAG: transcriptional regulator with XRE-family HTH domain [Parasphingorhabdus sp.]|jgi:transcriptional regulator with XRE-family HTH domain|uniref:helix-turn-helix domain-containing protein n=1 Tax=Parasphingorhabdus sp. TaxID=2709688 RepID=UPI0039E6F302